MNSTPISAKYRPAPAAITGEDAPWCPACVESLLGYAVEKVEGACPDPWPSDPSPSDPPALPRSPAPPWPYPSHPASDSASPSPPARTPQHKAFYH
ncbi:hypothetical protein DL766_009648 [Monosporascus sp. MC13-8B]|uniref:LITAF domain-containing protein n=1 Tax=Monosporascus cannonballus TaxID=155416 RepID=A0ABY0GUI7_9PEZI|nr:hypothetical protein DL762_009196 [Monosporascus cannonballus]RYO96085.1 hypothetical protein DL763_003375 [Monosporascus cannonballus]RYP14521.1 hypothetical protein DL766_009648 [Monosporascus sp. MC13-8B]